MPAKLLATMITTTTYGSWLPGNMRGYVENGVVLPGDPERLELATSRMRGSPVYFTPEQQDHVFNALCTAAIEFEYSLSDVSIEKWHLHWIISHRFDTVETMVGRLKNRIRQALNIGRIWTEGYFSGYIFDDQVLIERQAYIAQHPGCRLSQGRIVHRH